MARRIRLILHNLRSTHNVGAILRTAEGLGVEHVYLSGYTPYPAKLHSDRRLPHLATKIDRQIAKTALGAEKTLAWSQHASADEVLLELPKDFTVVALEQTPQAFDLTNYKPPAKVALTIGNEVTGLPAELLSKVDQHVQIPMAGRKESFNVAAATAIALYHFRYRP